VLLCLYNFHIKCPEPKVAVCGFPCGTTVLNVWTCTPMPHMDFKSKGLRHRDKCVCVCVYIYIYIYSPKIRFCWVQKAWKTMCFVFLLLQEIEPNVGAALRSLWDKIPPFVPKSIFFGSLKTFQEMPDTASSSRYVGYHERPIRGYSHMACVPSYQNYGVKYGHHGQHPQ
jgi:hypothetical protein